MRLSRPARRRIVAGSVVSVVLAGLAGVALASDSAPFVQYGDSGDAVHCVQEAINLSPAHASVHGQEFSDGYFGTDTDDAVRVFQDTYQANDPRIQVNGIVSWREGDIMWDILRDGGGESWCFDVLPTNSAEVNNQNQRTNLNQQRGTLDQQRGTLDQRPAPQTVNLDQNRPANLDQNRPANLDQNRPANLDQNQPVNLDRPSYSRR